MKSKKNTHREVKSEIISEKPVNTAVAPNLSSESANETGTGQKGVAYMLDFKKNIGIFALVSVVLISLSCSSPANRMAKAEDNVLKASQELTEAQQEYSDEVEAFRKESAKKIAANEDQIDQLKKRTKSADKSYRAEYRDQISELKTRNNSLKDRMDNYKADRRENWSDFKTGFNKEMNELTVSIKEFRMN